jgi:hypothetical protein
MRNTGNEEVVDSEGEMDGAVGNMMVVVCITD